ncbi:reverse transcriptase domain-containing protein [Tanacetum coccineum]
MKLNPKKSTFGAEEGMFLGHVVNMKGIKACPKKAEAIIKLQSPRTLKWVHSLIGKLASLSRFLSKSAEKSIPFFKTLKNCIKKSDFQWTAEAEKAFQEMKKHIVELPLLAAPKPKEDLIMYLYAAKEAINAVLLTERELKQMLIYFVSRALQAPEINYNSMEKLILALVHASRRLRRYFQARTIVVVTDQPIKQILSRPENARRMAKWHFELAAYDIKYRPRTSISGQVLANFTAERPEEDGPPIVTPAEEEIPESWILFTDGSPCLEGSGAGLILTNLDGMEFTYALRFKFDASNNEAKYESLVAGLRIAEKMGVKNLVTKVDSHLVANQINGSYIAKEQSMIQYLEKAKALISGFRKFSIKEVPRSENKKADALSKIASTNFAHLTKQVLLEVLEEKSIEEKEILAVVEEEGYFWMTPLFEYLTDDTLPAEAKKARAIKIKSIQYAVIDGVLYRKSFLEPWLRCVGPLQAEYVVREIHEGAYSMHFGLRFVVAKAVRS